MLLKHHGESDASEENVPRGALLVAAPDPPSEEEARARDSRRGERVSGRAGNARGGEEEVRGEGRGASD